MQITLVDLDNPLHSQAVMTMMTNYATDPMGGGQDLAPDVKAKLISQLKKQPLYSGFIMWNGKQPIGLANCFAGFSTFKAQPLLNIHDFAISEEYRGQGLGQQLMQFVCEFAKQQGHCKVTLEVLSNNQVAKNVYAKAGFAQYKLASDVAEFWQKYL
ncbi:GNAT family N-acetyltransferase [Saccharobesus litoralis]|uniref:GNAT family N-acetyltransferase n=1 Tax=Saccharobesus litoralis TaxID=2172099 RepID=A0A2S0VQP6_9ALTE|nr:GNAT family N-acetyltransferase [Saccharobesus litoralis]AWB66524.1 GNAT family N-acetyltransferase [Saccharobesus litoralis]